MSPLELASVDQHPEMLTGYADEFTAVDQDVVFNSKLFSRTPDQQRLTGHVLCRSGIDVLMV
jgi:hypothetical protein